MQTGKRRLTPELESDGDISQTLPLGSFARYKVQTFNEQGVWGTGSKRGTEGKDPGYK